MRFKEAIEGAFRDALEDAGYADGDAALVLEKPRQKEHGDLATPIALSLARTFKQNPMEIASRIVDAAKFPERMVSSADVAKPGYINLRLAAEVLSDNLNTITGEDDAYGTSSIGRGARYQVEYVSANPTGPLVVVSARAAAVGSVIVNLLRAVGYDVEAEYYVNDYGNQILKLGESLRFRARERQGLLRDGEEIGAYPGEYLKAIAAKVSPKQMSEWEADSDGMLAAYGAFASDALLSGIEKDLEAFGVHFDSFFRESSMHPKAIAEARKIVEDAGHTRTKDGALYFKTSDFGDEKDRVIIKSDGLPTYFLGDIAYHLTKIRRGHAKAIDLLGPDHHGHIPRMKAAAAVIGADADWFEPVLVGWVRLMEGDKPVGMSKRAGEFVTLRELMDDVGTDVAKYFFLMRRANSPLDFDLELARTQSDENPVYYVQYAHARIASVIRFAEQKGAVTDVAEVAPEGLESDSERDLMVHLLFYPYVVEGAARAREPHRLTVYARELATLFHQFYHAHRIVTDDPRVSAARMLLARATQVVLKNALHLMGVSAPSSM